MPQNRPQTPILVAVVALVGGLVFVAALGVGVATYLTTFGASATTAAANGARNAFIDVLLFSAFAMHHSVFARSGMRAWVASVVPERLERSVYVWIASLLFIGLCLAWQPVPGTLWHVDAPWSVLLIALQVTGLVITALGSRQLDVLDLAGIRQAMGVSKPDRIDLVRSGVYAIVRHPIYLGWVLMVWAVPTLTATRLVFAAVSTAYLVLAVPFEERSLRRSFVADYDAYARHTRWKIVPWVH